MIVINLNFLTLKIDMKIWVKKGTAEVVSDKNINNFDKDSIEQITYSALSKRREKVWVKRGTDQVIPDNKINDYAKDDIERITQNALSRRKAKVWVKKGTDEVVPDKDINDFDKDDIEQITHSALGKRREKVWVKRSTDEVIPENKINDYAKDDIEQITKSTLNRRKVKVWVKKGTDEVVPDKAINDYAKNDIEQITQNALVQRKGKVWVKKGTAEVVPDKDINNFDKDSIEHITQKAFSIRKAKVWVKKGTDEVISENKINDYGKDDIEQITQNALNKRKAKVWVKKGTDEVISENKINDYGKDDIEQITQNALNKRKVKVWVKIGTNEVVPDKDINDYAKNDIEQITQNALVQRKVKVWVKIGTDEVIPENKINDYAQDDIEQITRNVLIQRKVKVWVKKGTAEIIPDKDINNFDKDSIEHITQTAFRIRKAKVWVKRGTTEVVPDDKISDYVKDDIEQITQNVLTKRKAKIRKQKTIDKSSKDNKLSTSVVNTSEAEYPLLVPTPTIIMHGDKGHKRKRTNERLAVATAQEMTHPAVNDAIISTYSQVTSEDTIDLMDTSIAETSIEIANEVNSTIVPTLFFKRSKIQSTTIDLPTTTTPLNGNQTYHLSHTSFFQQPNGLVIKRESVDNNMSLDIDTIINKLRKIIKDQRKKSRATMNCGHWAKYTLITLNNLLSDKPCPNEKVSSRPSTNDTTRTVNTFELIPIKNDEGKSVGDSNNIRPLSSLRVASETGLNSLLPPTIECYVDIDTLIETEIINLNPDMVPMTKVECQNLNNALKTKANDSQSLIIGTVTLVNSNYKNPDHVITFCATGNEVFYIDPQLYDAKNKKDPIFYDIHTAYEFTAQQDKALSKQSSTPKYRDHSFYLINNFIKIDNQLRNII